MGKLGMEWLCMRDMPKLYRELMMYKKSSYFIADPHLWSCQRVLMISLQTTSKLFSLKCLIPHCYKLIDHLDILTITVWLRNPLSTFFEYQKLPPQWTCNEGSCLNGRSGFFKSEEVKIKILMMVEYLCCSVDRKM